MIKWGLSPLRPQSLTGESTLTPEGGVHAVMGQRETPGGTDGTSLTLLHLPLLRLASGDWGQGGVPSGLARETQLSQPPASLEGRVRAGPPHCPPH